MGKTNPLNDRDMEDFLQHAPTRADSENSWRVPVADLNTDTWDLTVRNPNSVEEVDNRTPQEIIAEIEELDAQAAEALQKIKEIL
jgi:type I restriction enzyme M protein